jgi:RNA polymerase sigma factor (sigma-70 family)
VVDEIRDVFLSMRLALARVVSRIVPPHDVEDIVQETYVRLCKMGKTQRIQHPRAYLFKTARNLALDSIKRAENQLADSWDEQLPDGMARPDTPDDEMFEQAASREEFDHFCEAVRQLPVQARRVFVLKKVYGYSQREIALELGVAESTVEKHVALAVMRCTAYMKQQACPTPVTRDWRADHHG